MKALDMVERKKLRRDLPPFRPGDTVRVHVNIREGDKQRVQVFEGVVIRRRRGGSNASFTVRKKRIEIKSRGHVRRSRLYYLRELRGKKARLRSKLRDLSALIAPEEAEARAEAEAAVLPAVEEPEAKEETPVEEAAAPEAEPAEEKPSDG
jgi:large subunit ribosomal protein L19